MLFGEAEHARWTQEIPTPPLCNLDKEAVNMFSSNVQKIENADAVEVRCERTEALNERRYSLGGL